MAPYLLPGLVQDLGGGEEVLALAAGAGPDVHAVDLLVAALERGLFVYNIIRALDQKRVNIRNCENKKGNRGFEGEGRTFGLCLSLSLSFLQPPLERMMTNLLSNHYHTLRLSGEWGAAT
jgi:hypothetical protein